MKKKNEMPNCDALSSRVKAKNGYIELNFSWINKYTAKNPKKGRIEKNRKGERELVLTNSTKAWLRLAPTLHLVLMILPKGLQSSLSSSSEHSQGRLRRWSTLEGVWVYRNWCWFEVDIACFQIPMRDSSFR